MNDISKATGAVEKVARERSTEEKVGVWAEATRHTLLFYDLANSFGPSTLPLGERRIASKMSEEKVRLGKSIWEAGNEAVSYLLENIAVADGSLESALPVEDLHNAYSSLHKHYEEFLDQIFYPDLLELIEAGVIESNASVGEVRSYWSEYRLASKAMVFLSSTGAIPNGMDESFDDLSQRIAAIAILETIDDCVLSSMDDGARLDESAITVGRLRGFLSKAGKPAFGMDQWKRMAMSERGAELAKRRHQKTNEARDWVVAQWSLHASAYEGNKSAFSRDYVRLVLQKFDAKVTEKQMREVWLKGPLLPAARTACQ